MEANEFYNNFDAKLIKDYLVGNLRIESAINFAKSRIARSPGAVCDIGCGIGWSTYEFSKLTEANNIVGVDLSDTLIQVAKDIFVETNKSYIQRDLTKPNWQLNRKFSHCVLIDVFEHIPIDSRLLFYQELNEILLDQASIILTCPTVFHQEYLRQHQPSGLQPVDEDVTLEVIRDFAVEVGGEITYFEYKDIWLQNDYLYIVIEKSPTGMTKLLPSKAIGKLEDRKDRYARIQASLGQEFLASHNLDKLKSNHFIKRVLRKLKKPTG